MANHIPDADAAGFKLFGKPPLPLPLQQAPGAAGGTGGGEPLPCPRCGSRETKFCYFNNYNVRQPRHLCRACRRYWTAGGALRRVASASPGRRRPRPTNARSASAATAAAAAASSASAAAEEDSFGGQKDAAGPACCDRETREFSLVWSGGGFIHDLLEGRKSIILHLRFLMVGSRVLTLRGACYYSSDVRLPGRFSDSFDVIALVNVKHRPYV
ncbi:unnamed protein product [Miscanthus lutarioriparius]|uniref:Dof-type domain-containing protein n=1 Tax=Miscanthus lutarioriparius TaxID=422564 RepID=A0A811P670_9POAL|nr:unnamed protein product [Miscanthus lutarioriparius]